MQSLRLWNVRSFEDTKDVALRKLTLLVGKNASGKSTFARWLPLLRQSVIRPTSAPLSWYVEGGDVDFGSTVQVVRREQNELGFGFRLDPYRTVGAGGAVQTTEGLSASVYLDAASSTGSVRRVELTREGDDVTLVFAGTEVVSARVNDHEVQLGIAAEAGTRHLLPVSHSSPTGSGASSPVAREAWTETALHHELYRAIRGGFHGQTPGERPHNVAHSLAWVAKGQFRNELANAPAAPPMFGVFVGTLTSAEIERIRSLVVAREAVSLLRVIDDALRMEASQVGYVGPFRKSPSRYERVSDIATDLIDHSGANLPMVLRSMTVEERSELSDWLLQHLGFGVSLSGEEHVQVRIVERGGREVNIIDTGFGYSQILPVAVALWRARSSRGGRTLVLEQPELHLHPGLQGLLGKLLASIVAGPGPKVPLRLIIETHSEALLNAVGEAIEFDRLDREDVSIALFERDEVSGISTVRQGQFDTSGRLADWPRGFLAG